MRFSARGAEDVLDLDAPRGQSVGDQRPVASPGDCLRAHDHHLLFVREIQQAAQARGKIISLHVVGVSPEGCIPPRRILGIGPGMAETTQFR